MTTTTTDLANAAAARFRALRERAAAKHAKARSDAATLRARVQRESQEKMAEAKRRKAGDEQEERLVSQWPKAEAASYRFDDADDVYVADTAEPAPAEAPPRPAPAPEPVRAQRPRRDDFDDENMSEVDTWLR